MKRLNNALSRMLPGNALVPSLDLAWSEEAREASAESRKANAHGRQKRLPPATAEAISDLHVATQTRVGALRAKLKALRSKTWSPTPSTDAHAAPDNSLAERLRQGFSHSKTGSATEFAHRQSQQASHTGAGETPLDHSLLAQHAARYGNDHAAAAKEHNTAAALHRWEAAKPGLDPVHHREHTEAAVAHEQAAALHQSHVH